MSELDRAPDHDDAHHVGIRQLNAPPITLVIDREKITDYEFELTNSEKILVSCCIFVDEISITMENLETPPPRTTTRNLLAEKITS